jgi:type IV pilus assembly protein PilB
MADQRRGGSAEPVADSSIQAAIEEFFDNLDEGDAEAPLADDRGRIRTRGDGRADSLLDGLIRVIIRKDPVREADVEAAFERAFAKLPGLVNAELALVYARKPLADRKGKLSLIHAFPAPGHAAGKPSAVLRFDQGVAKLKQQPVDARSGILGRVLSKRTSVTTHDVKADKDFSPDVDRTLGSETRNMLTVPIQDGPALLGAVQLRNKDLASGAEFFSLQDQQLVEEVARHVARIVRRFDDGKLAAGETDMTRFIAHLARSEALDLLAPDPKNPKKLAISWDMALWEALGVDAIRKYQVLPLRAANARVSGAGDIKGDATKPAIDVVMANPLDVARRRYFELATEHSIREAFAATPAHINAVLEKQLGTRVRAAEQDALLDRVAVAVAERPIDVAEVEKLEPNADTPIVQLANHLIEDAHSRGASDIHVEPGEKDVRIRYRVDGNLSERMRLPRQAHEPLVARLKIMAPPMKIDERRLPQDGKIRFKNYSAKGTDIDLRVATSPSSNGERCVLRLLAKQSIALGLDAMGFSEKNLEAFRWGSHQPYGMILCCGPTGSGKTTTLYAALNEINTPDVNILTAEDPIEYPLAGITQVQVNKKIGLGFARALKAFLRMDPDVILVGEIRDRKTAGTAIEAALTGHLLLSTLHTNDAASTVTRFIEMKIEPFLVSSVLLLISAQRLARRLCTSCREPWTPTAQALEMLAADPAPTPRTLFKASEQGCEQCQGSGYKGRIGIHEILSLQGEMGSAVRELIHKKAGSETIKARAQELGMRTMWQDALAKVKAGVTDLREVAAIVRADQFGRRRAPAKAAPRTTPSRAVKAAPVPRAKTSTRRTKK